MVALYDKVKVFLLPLKVIKLAQDATMLLDHFGYSMYLTQVVQSHWCAGAHIGSTAAYIVTRCFLWLTPTGAAQECIRRWPTHGFSAFACCRKSKYSRTRVLFGAEGMSVRHSRVCAWRALVGQDPNL
jgi:hypothetical protein